MLPVSLRYHPVGRVLDVPVFASVSKFCVEATPSVVRLTHCASARPPRTSEAATSANRTRSECGRRIMGKSLLKAGGTTLRFESTAAAGSYNPRAAPAPARGGWNVTARLPSAP